MGAVDNEMKEIFEAIDNLESKTAKYELETLRQAETLVVPSDSKTDANTGLGNIIDDIRQVVGAIYTYAVHKIPDGISNISSTVSTIKTDVDTIASSLSSASSEAVDWLKKEKDDLTEAIHKEAKIVTDISTEIQNAIDSGYWEKFKKSLKSGLGDQSTAVTDLQDWVNNLNDAALDHGIDLKLKNDLPKFSNPVPTAITSTLSGFVDDLPDIALYPAYMVWSSQKTEANGLDFFDPGSLIAYLKLHDINSVSSLVSAGEQNSVQDWVRGIWIVLSWVEAAIELQILIASTVEKIEEAKDEIVEDITVAGESVQVNLSRVVKIILKYDQMYWNSALITVNLIKNCIDPWK